mgnify:FL=1
MLFRSELQNSEKIQFGFKRFKNLLAPLAGLEPSEMAKRIEKSLDDFQGEAAQYDDLSLLIVKFNA